MNLPLLAALALAIMAAKLGGWLSSRLGQPVVLGKLFAGLVLGPSLLNIFGLEVFESAHVVDSLREFGELGVIFLMFTAGLEVDIADMMQAGRPAVLAGVVGVLAPILLAPAAVLPFGYTLPTAILLGIVMAATSVSISAQTLIELDRLRSREGLTLLGAAVVDDVLAIGVLSIFAAVALGNGGGLPALLWVFARMALFLSGAFVLGRWSLPRLVHWIEARRLPVSEPVLSLVVVVILLFAWSSEFVGGVAAITGAFIAGVALVPSVSREKIARGIHAMAYALFVPVFLVSIGLTADARSLTFADLGLVVTISAVAILSKLIGAGGGARLGGMSWLQALRVGVGMISRGEVGLIVASVGVTNGLLPPSAFTAIVLMVLVTTLATPPLLRLAFRDQKEASHA